MPQEHAVGKVPTHVGAGRRCWCLIRGERGGVAGGVWPLILLVPVYIPSTCAGLVDPITHSTAAPWQCQMHAHGRYIPQARGATRSCIA